MTGVKMGTDKKVYQRDPLLYLISAVFLSQSYIQIQYMVYQACIYMITLSVPALATGGLLASRVQYTQCTYNSDEL